MVLGWICTATVLVGFFLNSKKYHFEAMILWIIGDIGWIIYDWTINNWSHAALPGSIIAINIYGIYYRQSKNKKMSRKTFNFYKDLFE